MINHISSIYKAGKVLDKGFALKLGSGEVSFFFDAWFSNEPLCNQVPWVQIHDTALRVKDVLRDGSWHLHEIMTLLPNPIKLAVEGFNVLLDDSIPDCISWLGNMDVCVGPGIQRGYLLFLLVLHFSSVQPNLSSLLFSSGFVSLRIFSSLASSIRIFHFLIFRSPFCHCRK
ncbi:hypothetical protein RIF29_16573 [Crotalaria pallida]|uniref:Uncharacterized protein n=1 Tax=Crotalaria pallida TaxID=3830 RepID=A0AAN9IJY0_CROPI